MVKLGLTRLTSQLTLSLSPNLSQSQDISSTRSGCWTKYPLIRKVELYTYLIFSLWYIDWNVLNQHDCHHSLFVNIFNRTFYFNCIVRSSEKIFSDLDENFGIIVGASLFWCIRHVIVWYEYQSNS